MSHRPDSSQITQILHSLEKGERIDAAQDLLPLVYAELKRQADRMMASERPGQTLQATALVHEAYLRVVGVEDPQWSGRQHFLTAATEAMRRILIDQARRKKRCKHGGDHERVGFDEAEIVLAGHDEDVLEVDEILQALEADDPRLRTIVNLRYFGGYSNQEAAEALGVSLSTVERDWRFIRAWLTKHLGAERGES